MTAGIHSLTAGKVGNASCLRIVCFPGVTTHCGCIFTAQ